MQIRYLVSLLFQKIALPNLFNFLEIKKFPYFAELRFLISNFIFLNTFIYYNYSVGFLTNTTIFKYEDLFDLIDVFEYNYPHLFTLISLPRSPINWQFLCFFFNDKLVYSDILLKSLQRGQFF